MKTNAIYNALAIPNIGIDLSAGQHWSIGADWHYAWWTNHRKLWWKTYGGNIHFDRWFRTVKDTIRYMQGHKVGIYGQMLTYDFELGGKGEIAPRWNFALGMEYGYAHPIGRRMQLEYVIGIGYMWGAYKTYQPDWNPYPRELHYVWKSTHQRHWLGPTKCELNLVWYIESKKKKS